MEDPSRKVIVSVKATASDFIEANISTSDIDSQLDKYIYYSEPFPDNFSKYKFRIKLVYEQSVRFIYITCWKPVNPNHNASISYSVELRQQQSKYYPRSPTYSYNTSDRDDDLYGYREKLIKIKQPHYNKWMLVHQIKEDKPQVIKAFCFKITDIESLNDPVVEFNPLSWVSLLADNVNHDIVELIGKDSCKVEVLQIALKCSSEVFTRMFSQQWRENKGNCVQLKDLDMQGLQELKEYMYRSTSPKKSVTQLFDLASMYGMEHLKYCCAKVLYANITPDSAFDVLKIASHYEYKPLVKAICLYFEEHL